MATAAPTQELPLFYNKLEALNAGQHGKMKIRRIESAPQMGVAHAVPVTVDEFGLLQRHYPIVFSIGGDPVPLALMGLNEGANAFLDPTRASARPEHLHPGPTCAVIRSCRPLAA
jgi:hypothetical protein